MTHLRKQKVNTPKKFSHINTSTWQGTRISLCLVA